MAEDAKLIDMIHPTSELQQPNDGDSVPIQKRWRGFDDPGSETVRLAYGQNPSPPPNSDVSDRLSAVWTAFLI